MFFGMAAQRDPLAPVREFQRRLERARRQPVTAEDYARFVDAMLGRSGRSPRALDPRQREGVNAWLENVANGRRPAVDYDAYRRSVEHPYHGADGELVLEFSIPDHDPRTNHMPPVQSIRTVTTQDDPRLAGVNERLGAMYANPRTTERQMEEYLAQFGISSGQIPEWRHAMDWRRTSEFRRWANASPGQRPAHTINLDDSILPEPRVVAVRDTPAYTAEARAYRPSPIIDPVARGWGALDEALGGDRYSRQAAEQRMRSFLRNPLSPVEPLEWAIETDRRSREAAMRGDYGASAREHLATVGNAALAVPIFGRARNGVRLGERLAGNVEALIGRRLGRNYAQHSWESVPGRTTGHLNGLGDLPWEDRQAYHQEVRNIFLDEEGRSRIASAYGFPAARSFDSIGVYDDVINPGTQDRIRVSLDPRTGLLDDRSRNGLNAISDTHGLLGSQDAAAWNFLSPFRSSAAEANAFDFTLGRTIDRGDVARITPALRETYPSGNVEMLPSPRGARIIQFEEEEGMPPLHELVERLRHSDPHLRSAPMFPTTAISNLETNAWNSTGRYGARFGQSLATTDFPDLPRNFDNVAPQIAYAMLHLDPRTARHHGFQNAEQIDLVRRTIADRGWDGLMRLIRSGSVSRSVVPLLLGMGGLSTIDNMEEAEGDAQPRED